MYKFSKIMSLGRFIFATVTLFGANGHPETRSTVSRTY